MRTHCTIYFVFAFLVTCVFQVHGQEVFLQEDFESGYMPSGWTQEKISGNLLWDIRTGAGTDAVGNQLTPDTAAVGTYNIVFQKQGVDQEVTRLISPPMNLELAMIPELRFWYAMEPFQGVDYLRVLYRQGQSGEWTELANFETATAEWQEYAVTVPAGSDETYIAFEGTNNWGMGACVDEIELVETVTQPLYISSVSTEQACNDRLAAGTENNAILKTEIRVKGNTSQLNLNSLTVHSLNTDDNDLDELGVNLYFTDNPVFNTSTPVGASVDFNSGVATFNNLNLNLDAGYSYLWVTYDVRQDAGNLHIADALIPENGISDDQGLTHPAEEQNPIGHRTIYRTLLYDSFETDNGWVLTGEFEMDVPAGLGGVLSGGSGAPGANAPYCGNKILGTDVTGLGMYPGNYEDNLSELEYTAVSPSMDCSWFTEITLSYFEWLNVYFSGNYDKATIDLSIDGGTTWEQVWRNDGTNLFSTSWKERNVVLENAARQPDVKIRFTLGPTLGTQNYSGWNIDNLMVTGNFLTKDMAVTEWLYPFDECGMSDQEQVAVKVANLASVATPTGVPVKFSLDGGQTWMEDVISQSILPGDTITHVFQPTADFSTPGHYDNIIAKVFLENDQMPDNDFLSASVFSVPQLQRPYVADFDLTDQFWAPSGVNSSWIWQEPCTANIDSSYNGDYAWVTNHAGAYNPGEASWITSPCFDFQGSDYSAVEFQLRNHTPHNLDGVSMQYSVNGGNTWQTLNVFQDTLTWNWFNSSSISSLLGSFGDSKGWSGDNNAWERIAMVLPESVSDHSKVRFRFVFAGQDDTGNWEGTAFDAFRIFRAPPDLGISGIVNPVNDCELSQNQTITVTIKNFGINKLDAGTQIPVALQLDSSEFVYETAEANTDVLPGESMEYTFEATFDMRQPAVYNITATTLMEDDAGFYEGTDYSSNDTLFTEVIVYGFPEPNLGEDIYTLQPDTVLLDAGDGFHGYEWHDGSTGQYYTPEIAGNTTCVISVVDGNMCAATDTLMIYTYDLVVDEFVDPHSDCVLPLFSEVKVRLTNNGMGQIPEGAEIPLVLYYEEVLMLQDTVTLDAAVEHLGSFVFDFETIIQLYSIPEGNNVSGAHYLNDGNPHNDSLSVSVVEYGFPEIELGDTIFSTQPDTLILSPGNQFDSYLWQDGSEDPVFEVQLFTSEEYSVEITDQYGCPASDTVSVLTWDLETPDLTAPLSKCEFGSNEVVKTSFVNTGFDTIPAGVNVPVSLSFMSVLIEQDTLVTQSYLAPGESFDHTFDSVLDMTFGENYFINISHQLVDGDFSNNNKVFEVEEYGYPEISLGDDICTTLPDTVTLDAGEGFQSVYWQDGSEGQYFQVSSPLSAEYSVVVTDTHNCSAQDALMIYTHDYDLTSFIHPSSACELSAEESVMVRLWNHGLDNAPAESLPLYLEVNGVSVATDTVFVTHTLEPGQYIDFEFEPVLNMENIGDYDLKVFHGSTDGLNTNDTLSERVTVAGYPDPLIPHFVATNEPDTVILDAGEGFAGYMWSDGSDEQFFEVNDYGTYGVTVSNEVGCSSDYTIFVVEEFTDLALYQLVSPDTICSGLGQVRVSVKLKNTGSLDIPAGTSLDLGYVFEDQQVSAHTITTDTVLAPLDSIIVQFPDKIENIGYERWQLTSWVKVEGDEYSVNDTLITEKPVFELPKPLDIDDIFTTMADTVVLDAGEGFDYYLWQNGNQNRFFNVSSPNTKKYSVTVVDDNLCAGKGNVWVNTYDLDICRWVSPVDICGLSSDETLFEVKMTNKGADPFLSGDTIPLTFSMPDHFTVYDTLFLQNDFMPGDTLTIQMMAPVTVSEARGYEFSISQDMKDANPDNDTLVSEVDVYNLPVIDLGSDIYTSQPDTIVLDAGAGFASYLWQNGFTQQLFDVSAAGSYWVNVADNHGCVASDTIVIHFSTGSENLLDETVCRFYPNPVIDHANIEFDRMPTAPVTIRILNMNGSTVFATTDDTSLSTIKLDLQHLHSGVYFIHLSEGGDRNQIIKFIKN